MVRAELEWRHVGGGEVFDAEERRGRLLHSVGDGDVELERAGLQRVAGKAAEILQPQSVRRRAAGDREVRRTAATLPAEARSVPPWSDGVGEHGGRDRQRRFDE